MKRPTHRPNGRYAPLPLRQAIDDLVGLMSLESAPSATLITGIDAALEVIRDTVDAAPMPSETNTKTSRYPARAVVGTVEAWKIDGMPTDGETFSWHAVRYSIAHARDWFWIHTLADDQEREAIADAA